MKELVKKAISVSLLSLLGAVSGLALDLMVVSWAGLSSTADAYFIALTVPQFFNSLVYISINPLVSAFVAWSKTYNQIDTQKLISSILALWIGVAVIITAIAMLATSPIIRLLGPGVDSHTAEEAIVLARILLPTIVMASASSVLAAVLNAAQHFAIPASGLFIRYSFAVLTAYMLPAEMGLNRVAIGLLIGDGMRLIITLVACILLTSFRFRLPTLIFSSSVIQANKLVLATLSGHIVGYMRVFMERILGSLFGEGGVAALGYSSRFITATSILVFDSITVVALPTLTYLRKDENYTLLKQTFDSYTRLMFLVSVFAATMFIGLSDATISLLFGGGAVSNEDVMRMVTVVRAYGLGLLFIGYVRLVHTFFLALGDARSILTLYMTFTVFNLATSAVLAQVIGISGIALGYPIAACITGYWGSNLSKRKMGWPSLPMVNLRLAFPALFTLASIHVSLTLLGNLGNSTITNVGLVVFSGVIGTLVFLVSLPIAGGSIHMEESLGICATSRILI